MWKQRLGSDGTYQKLIDIFEHAGYDSYADVVRKIACSIDSEVQREIDDDFSNCNEFLSQPETYPHHKSNISLPNNLSMTSSSEEYVQVNSTAARNLPQGKSLININSYTHGIAIYGIVPLIR